MSPQPSGKSWIEHPVYAYVKGGFESGLSGNQILGALKEAGAGFRRTDFYAMLADVRGFYVHQDRIKFTPRSLKIDPTNFTQGSSTQRDKYQYEFQHKDYVKGGPHFPGDMYRQGTSKNVSVHEAFKGLNQSMEASAKRVEYPFPTDLAYLEEHYNVIALYERPEGEFTGDLW